MACGSVRVISSPEDFAGKAGSMGAPTQARCEPLAEWPRTSATEVLVVLWPSAYEVLRC